jgi:hypothetical protein
MKTQGKLSILILLMVSLSFIVFAQQHHPTKCGTWRWDVKTLTDQDGAALLSHPATPSSINELVKEKPPKTLHASKPSDGTKPRYSSESQVVEIIAMVTAVKTEADDSDMHFVLKSTDSDKTMVGEIPDPNCPNFEKFPQLKDFFTKTRADGKAIWDKLKKTHKPVKVRITGVPFWDGVHSKPPIGSSKYCREIHPILTIVQEP